jgi:hypothetical protein
MDYFEMWKQRRDEMMREAQQNHLAKGLRGSRGGRGVRLVAFLTWELERGAGRLRKLFGATDEADRK